MQAILVSIVLAGMMAIVGWSLYMGFTQQAPTGRPTKYDMGDGVWCYVQYQIADMSCVVAPSR